MNRGRYFSPGAGLWAFVGNYGSGKTEVAVNFALAGSVGGITPVSIIDLDIVNPYFRSREVEDILENYKINVISPKGDLKYADLPIILPNVKSSIKDFRGLMVLDIGGEDTGATVIKPFRDFLQRQNSHICMVINLKRPFTSNEENILETKKRIEDKIEIKIQYFINNTNLIDQTEAGIILEGHKTVRKASQEAGAEFLFTAVLKEYLPLMDSSVNNGMLFPIDRFMLPPWHSDIQKFKLHRNRRSIII